MPSAKNVDRRDSLPLMGIGNFFRAGLRLVKLLLITPHGDWKPSNSLNLRSASTLSHYPSWGLETKEYIDSEKDGD